MARRVSPFFVAVIATSPAVSIAASPDEQLFAYIQYGQWDSAREATFGLETPWPLHLEGEQWTSFWQGELSEWRTKMDGRHYVSSAECAIGPVGRYFFDESRALYFEGVVNLALISPRFWRDSEQQGSVLNFAGAFAFGYRFGQNKSSEISVRAEHFSDAGIRVPNPGRNFFQLRYATHF